MRLVICAVFLLFLFLCDATPIDRTKGFQINKRDELEAKENIMDHITKANSEVQDKFEADINLSGDESDVDLRNEGDVDGPLAPSAQRRRRSAERDKKNMWIGRIVPYVIDSSLTSATATIEEAIAEFHTHSCLVFQPRTDETNYVNFIAKDGCWSSIGRQYWSSEGQEVSLGSGCNNKGIIMHEMMHAVGFWHEQSRPDRNLYVEVLWENIMTGNEYNFNKYSHGKIDNLEVPYDMDSVMHYGTKSFSKNDLPTLRSIIDSTRPLGQRDGFTENDIQKLNALYDCATTGSDGWSSWSGYSPCSTACQKYRQRYCLSTDLNLCPGADSYGVETQTEQCPDDECYARIDGHWGRWSSWGDCSESCGLGNQTRTRLCDDPVPANNGSACTGSSSMDQDCVLVRCGLGPDDCEFDEQGLGLWSQASSDDLDWSRRSGATPSGNTGPSEDHTTGIGYYLYLESSSPAKTGNKARIQSGWFPAVDNRCLQFAYHMFGASMGTLSVKSTDYVSFTETTLWTMSGDQQNEWHIAKVDISSPNQYFISFEAERGTSFTGDLALDDVYFKEYACDSIPPTTEGPTAMQLPIISLGCWKNESPRIFSHLLQNLRSDMDWNNAGSSTQNIINTCYNYAVTKGTQIFGIEFYGECWAPGNVTEQVDYQKYGAGEACWNGVGASNKVNVYQMT
uniref:Metalloendopeptidase n=1 Tax=Pachycerianthus borealis TaxID=2736680 RepID=A0A7G7WYQ2_9CNID|nr:toxin candidate TRINITY_DN30581_c0_g1_i1 [Pachycerianthus borealis]